VLGLAGAASALFEGLYSYTTWAPVGLGVIALLVAVLLIRPFETSRAGLVAAGALTVLLAWAALSATWADSIERAWTEADRLGIYLAILLLALAATRTRRSARMAMDAIAVAVVGLAIYLVVRLLSGSGNELFFGFRLHEPLGYINGQAGLLLMGLMPVLVHAERARTAALRGLALGAGVVIAALIVLTQSRAVIPATVAVVVLTLAVLPGRLTRAWMLVVLGAGVAAALPALLDVYGERSTGGSPLPSDGALREAAAITLLSATACGALWAAAMSRRVRAALPIGRRASAVALSCLLILAAVAITVRVGNPGDELEGQWRAFTSLEIRQDGDQRFTDASGYRHDLWRIALDQFSDRPLTGVGAGNYASTYYLERRVDDFVRQPHSIELQFMGELGIVGALAFLLFVGAVFAAGLRPRRGRHLAADDLGLRIAALGMFTVWLVHTSVDWLYNLPGLTALALLAAAVLMARPAGADPPSHWLQAARPGRVAATLGLLLILAAVAASVGRHYGASLYNERAEDKLATDPQGALADARRSLSLNPHDISTYYVVAAGEARFNRYAEARRALLDGAAKEPFNYVPWVLLGDLATRRGDIAGARRDYARAKELNPRDPLITPDGGRE